MVCPDGQGEGSRVSLQHLQSTVLWRASVNKHLHFQNILSKCHYCEFIVLAILGFSDFYFLFLLCQNISNDKIDYTFLHKKNFERTRGSFLLKI